MPNILGLSFTSPVLPLLVFELFLAFLLIFRLVVACFLDYINDVPLTSALLLSIKHNPSPATVAYILSIMVSSRCSHTLSGCWYLLPSHPEKQYLPLVDLKSHTTILAITSRTKLTQIFHNPQTKDKLDEVAYSFPLYDGVSVVSFKCIVAGRTIIGVVKEKQQARTDYQAAVDRGKTAGLLEQVSEASDAFTTKIGNIPANEQVTVEIEYLGELKHDAETDGARFTIPTMIAPRYGSTPASPNSSAISNGISISVDVAVDDGSIIRGIQSPSHPITVTIGRISSVVDDKSFDTHHASATLALGSTVLGKDFVIVVLARGQDTPRALLETHPTIPNQRALMATLVPKFNLPSIHPEIVFVVDRSGSMGGRIPTLIAALKVFLKSLPVSVKFNICSFGSHHEFIFDKSKIYNQSNLQKALSHVESFGADFGGTEMYSAIEATLKNRLPGMPLEMLVLTDGQIWNQENLFTYIYTFSFENPVRVFSLGIGSGASSSLVEGIARAGNGFAQFVDDNEKMDRRLVRMLKGALSPRIKDYKIDVKYAKPSDEMEDDFEIIESVESDISKLVVDVPEVPSLAEKTISLFNSFVRETPTNPQAGRYDHLPRIAPPLILQAPHNIPPLYAFNRTTVYLLLRSGACQKTPSSVVLRATSEHGPLELEIPVQDVGVGQTIHQLAAKKAVHEIEQGRGWLSAKNFKEKLVGTQYESRMDEITEREAVQLGVEFQVGGKFCSFVALEDGVEQESVYAHESKDAQEETGPSIPRVYAKRTSFGFSSVKYKRGKGPSEASGSRRQLASMAPRQAAPIPGLLFRSSLQDQSNAKTKQKVDCCSEATIGLVVANLSDEDKVRALIDLNNFDGSWKMSPNLDQIMGANYDAVKDLKRAGWSEVALATAMVIAFLEVKLAKEEDIWEMVVEKAKNWLAANVSDAEEGTDVFKKLL